MSFLIRLPTDILLVIADYLLSTHEFENNKFSFKLDWKCLLNSCKVFATLKRKALYLELTESYSRQYVKEFSFRKKVMQTLKDISCQLSLKVQLGHGEEIPDSVNNIHKLALYSHRSFGTINFGTLTNITEFECYLQAELTNIQTLANCKSVTICSCDALTDVSCFKDVEVLSLTGCANIQDVSSFGRVKHLDLTGCCNVEDVSCLGNVYHLNLSGCNAVRDVSKLGNVYCLHLSQNSHLSDVSALGKVHILYLNRCPNVVDVSALHSVYQLSLSEFSGEDISSLINVTILDLSYCRYAHSLHPLANSVRELNIASSRISDISMLHQVVKLDISFCSKITNFAGLKNLKELMAIGWRVEVVSGLETFSQLNKLHVGEVKNVFELTTALKQNRCLHSIQLLNSNIPFQELSHVKELNCYDYRGQSFPTFSQSLIYLQSLKITNSNVFELPFLPSLGYLLLSGCPAISTLQLIGEETSFPIYEVYLDHCDNLLEISISRRIGKLKISGCNRLKKIHHSSLIRNLVTPEYSCGPELL
jgi:hypothetical protein